MSEDTSTQRLTDLEDALDAVMLLVSGVRDDLGAQKDAFSGFRTELQATIGPLMRQIQGESGILERLTRLEAQQYALMSQISDLQSFDAQQKRGPSTFDLANQVADLSRSLARLQNADRYALTRESLGRLMVAHNLVSPSELQESRQELLPESTEQPA